MSSTCTSPCAQRVGDLLALPQGRERHQHGAEPERAEGDRQPLGTVRAQEARRACPCPTPSAEQLARRERGSPRAARPRSARSVTTSRSRPRQRLALGARAPRRRRGRRRASASALPEARRGRAGRCRAACSSAPARFSRNARMPSLASGDCVVQPNTCASSRSAAAGSGSPVMCQRSRLVSATATGAVCSAISRASACAVGSSSASGTTRDTSPISSASRAPTSRPVSSSSAARLMPIEPRQQPRAGRLGHQAALHEDERDARALAREPDVPLQRQRRADAGDGAVQRRDHRLADVPRLERQRAAPAPRRRAPRRTPCRRPRDRRRRRSRVPRP